MRKFRAIIKRPGEPAGHMTWISDSLANLQNIVGGPIEVVNLGGGVLMICNEEGKLSGLENNFMMPGDIILGTVIICGAGEEDFEDIPISMKVWKSILKQWGNEV